MTRMDLNPEPLLFPLPHKAPHWFSGESLPDGLKATAVEEEEAGRAGQRVEVFEGQRTGEI